MQLRKITAVFAAIAMLTAPLSASAANGEFVMYRDNFMIPNGNNLGPRNYLTEEDHAALLANFQNTEKYTANLALQIESGGACYGMAAISMLSANGMVDAEALDERLIDNEYVDSDWHSISLLSCPKEFGAPYEVPARVTSYINYSQLTQATDAIRQNTAWQRYQMSDTERLQYLVECAKNGQATIFNVNGFLWELDYRQIHAVVATDVEYGTYECEWDGKTYDGCIKVYDSNIMSIYDWSNLYFNTSDWSWTLYGALGVTNETASIECVNNDVNLINHVGLMYRTEYTSENPFLGVFVTNELDSDYTVSKAALSGDSWDYTNETNDAMKETVAFYPDCVASAAKNFLTPDTDSGYVLDLETAQTLDAAMYYEDSLMRAQAGNASQFVAEPSGYMAISGEDSEYLFDMVFNDGYLCTDWYQMSVSGTADTASLQKTEEGYILAADNLQEITVNAKNDTVAAMLSFSADADSVLLYEIDEYTIGAAVDTDGDGSYDETIAQTSHLGDLDYSGSADATDAAAILVAAANQGSGAASGLTDEQKVYADVNNDGAFDATDAALVLEYAAYAGSGGTLGFEEYIAQASA